MTRRQINNAQDFASFLYMLAADLKESGQTFTARDTRKSAVLIAKLCAALQTERNARKVQS